MCILGEEVVIKKFEDLGLSWSKGRISYLEKGKLGERERRQRERGRE